MLVDGIAVIEGTGQPELARAFVEYIGSVQGQLLAARQAFRNLTRTDIPQDSLPGWLVAVNAELDPMNVDWQLLEEQGREVMVRHYSFSHPMLNPGRTRLAEPGSQEGYEFYIAMPVYPDTDRAPRFTPRLFALREGDRIFVENEAAGEYTAAPVGSVLSMAFTSRSRPARALSRRRLC